MKYFQILLFIVVANFSFGNCDVEVQKFGSLYADPYAKVREEPQQDLSKVSLPRIDKLPRGRSERDEEWDNTLVQARRESTYPALYISDVQFNIHLNVSVDIDNTASNTIPGVPGVDYPIFHSVPETSFHCKDVPILPGMYANVETGCQAYHVCHDGREGHQGAPFLCGNGTLFNQKEFTCDWWYNVHCQEAPQFYSLNADPDKNPFVPKRKPEEEVKKYAIVH